MLNTTVIRRTTSYNVVGREMARIEHLIAPQLLPRDSYPRMKCRRIGFIRMGAPVEERLGLVTHRARVAIVIQTRYEESVAARRLGRLRWGRHGVMA